MITNVSLSKHDSEPFDDPHLYRTIVGALQYAPITRPDIAFAVNKVSQFMHLRIGLPLSVYSDTLPAHSLMAFHFNPLPLSHCTPIVSDADWAGCPDDRRSTSGFCIYLGSKWSCKKQPTVARSSTESEYRSLALASAEIAWIQF